ncbi:MAG: hypothetical protein KY455_13930 [Euryarchaeota archaeon]|nr:hypothetical protein [Euryarchaeota archaeon]
MNNIKRTLLTIAALFCIATIAVPATAGPVLYTSNPSGATRLDVFSDSNPAGLTGASVSATGYADEVPYLVGSGGTLLIAADYTVEASFVYGQACSDNGTYDKSVSCSLSLAAFTGTVSWTPVTVTEDDNTTWDGFYVRISGSHIA